MRAGLGAPAAGGPPEFAARDLTGRRTSEQYLTRRVAEIKKAP
jgi:hypothetical protein